MRLLLLLPVVAAFRVELDDVAAAYGRGATVVTSFPRGGASQTVEGEDRTEDTDVDNNTIDNVDFDLEKESREIYAKEVEEIRAGQRFILKQQRRRELDKTWLDRGITAVVETIENIFRWTVTD
ncbi:hypothetical protein THAOC_12235 [Thalassiosira oceanica]|uniref:Uncharacterized protein n=1 Tax=Thalassiosira oceanica TaxID=159749 RepID=K0T8J8_THAOC|nr:hypothetical protein THAOC_12235 [Thalassiosira oceanica]|mmetsp:Transcript_36962/g.88422  ORF Transcript_36962/g.88422 Transcript_36962/m.88422 type:complete len:124 (+) Transcript_36962:67-438(+)|eukprot:EJK66807.1 hypothetical protein THAOC_12235 [Thalassiosira oceanica]